VIAIKRHKKHFPTSKRTSGFKPRVLSRLNPYMKQIGFFPVHLSLDSVISNWKSMDYSFTISNLGYF